MAVTIISESYGPRKPFVVCTAASTDELAEYAGLWAEGSEATISTTKYVLDRTKGWVEEGGSGGGGGSHIVELHSYEDPLSGDFYLQSTEELGDIYSAYLSGNQIYFHYQPEDDTAGELYIPAIGAFTLNGTILSILYLTVYGEVETCAGGSSDPFMMVDPFA